MTSFPAVLSLQELGSCFGYLNGDNYRETSGISIQAFSYNAVGVFNVKSLEKQTSVLIQLLKSYPQSKVYDIPQILHLDRDFASVNGFSVGEQVILEEVSDATECYAAYIRPKTQRDWDKINEHRDFIENNLLNQLQVIAENVDYPLFLKDKTVCFFSVEKLQCKSSKPYGVLVKHTKLVVSATSVVINVSSEELKDCMTDRGSIMKRILLQVLSGVRASTSSIVDELVRYSQTPFGEKCFRILPENLFEADVCRNIHPTAVFVASESGTCEPFISLVSLKRKDNSFFTYAVLFTITRLDWKFEKMFKVLQRRENHCLLSPHLKNDIFDSFTWLTCFPVPTSNLRQLRKILCLTSLVGDVKNYRESICEFFLERCTYFPIVLSSKGFSADVTFSGGKVLKCHFLPQCSKQGTELDCYIFACDSLPEIELVFDVPEDEAAENSSTMLKSLVNHENCGDLIKYAHVNLVNLPSQEDCMTECAKVIEYFAGMSQEIKGHLLLIGPRISGKTTIVRKLASHLFNSTASIYTVRVDCIYWQGRSVEFVKKQLSDICLHLAQRQPSFLVLENLDQGLPIKRDRDFDVDVERVFSTARRIVEDYRISMLATVENSQRFLETVVSTNGKRFFFRKYSVRTLKSEERRKALQYFIEQSGLECGDLGSAIEATGNYVIGDLERISQKIVYFARSRKHTIVGPNDIIEAFHQFAPICEGLENKKKKFNLSWDDVGGLDRIKKTLIEVFIWPSKYPELFRQCPVKIGQGVLLHGPSGCGKTMIAKIVASESSLSLIHIKGPELLSKYIGQSEENVRNVFERARMSAPSLIFFDEFDSLGAKRGHDNTGVTDRVVNQLLTELDGMEERGSVYVIATTNRLDLIDPALVRPGRFDFVLECSLPNQEERKAILEVLTRKVRLDKDVNLSYIASKTNGWSGADLKGLVISAQFLAASRAKVVDSAVDAGDNNNRNNMVCLEHLISALEERKVSTPVQRKENSPKIDSKLNLRVTLA